MTLPERFSLAPHLRLVCFPSTCVVLDEEKGTVRILVEEAARAVSDLSAAQGEISVFESTPERKRVLTALMDSGILGREYGPRGWDTVRRGVPSTPSWGTRDSPAALAPIPRVSLPWYLWGALALFVVLIGSLRKHGNVFARTRRLVRRASAGATDHGSAVKAAYAVRKVGRLLPWRVACWEEATATVIALRWSGHRSSFRHGVATDPVRLHAWVEVGGRPVAESDDITDYTPFEESDE
ncbi:lasso peptide biosynthesis B2 protein [Nocardiopsis sp. NPDC006832]|uniref:lasso peptide biosynthesis B2 protein n=1 Tax=Nocardiopsis sp. NPDC006832 TaxID=3157188 RepID=UPI0033D4371D